MINLSLTPDQFRVLFEMVILCIASTEKSPSREEMKEVPRAWRSRFPGSHGRPREPGANGRRRLAGPASCR